MRDTVALGHGLQVCARMVRFFVYEELHSFFEAACTLPHPDFQHRVEHVFVAQALRHHARVLRAEDADVFIVPAYLGLVANSRCSVGASEVQTKLTGVLHRSAWYWRHQARDHLLVVTDWHANALVRNLSSLSGMLFGSQLSTWLGHTRWRVDGELHIADEPRRLRAFAVPLTVRLSSAVALPFAARTCALWFGGQTSLAHASYEYRRLLVKNCGRFNIPVAVYSTSGEQAATSRGCVTAKLCTDKRVDGGPDATSAAHASLVATKFNAALPGDHGSASMSSRVYDALAASAINVFVGPHMLTYLPWPRLVPWASMSLVANEKDYLHRPAEEIERAITALLADPPRLNRTLRLMDRHRLDVLWELQPGEPGNVLDRTLELAARGATRMPRTLKAFDREPVSRASPNFINVLQCVHAFG